MTRFYMIVFCSLSWLGAVRAENEFFKAEQEALLKNEKNTYNRARIEERSFDFYKNLGEMEVFGIHGGVHIGTVYFYDSKKKQAYNVALGPIESVLTNQEFPQLGTHRWIVVSATGGTGVHHVVGYLVEQTPQEGLSLKEIAPLHGYWEEAIADDRVNISYTLQAIQVQKKTVDLTFDYTVDLENVKHPREKSKILRDLKMPDITFRRTLSYDLAQKRWNPETLEKLPQGMQYLFKLHTKKGFGI